MIDDTQYRDFDGNNVTLEKLVRTEPGWACSRIRHMTQQLTEANARIAELEAFVFDITDIVETIPPDEVERFRVLVLMKLGQLEQQND